MTLITDALQNFRLFQCCSQFPFRAAWRKAMLRKRNFYENLQGALMTLIFYFLSFLFTDYQEVNFLSDHIFMDSMLAISKHQCPNVVVKCFPQLFNHRLTMQSMSHLCRHPKRMTQPPDKENGVIPSPSGISPSGREMFTLW